MPNLTTNSHKDTAKKGSNPPVKPVVRKGVVTKPVKMPAMKKQGTSTGFMVGGPSTQDDNAAIN